MFGKYGVYRDGVLVALVCDDCLLVKPTTAGRAFAPDAGEARPIPARKLACWSMPSAGTTPSG